MQTKKVLGTVSGVLGGFLLTFKAIQEKFEL